MESLPCQLEPAGGMLERYLDPFLHGATKSGRIKQVGTRERERLAMPGGFQLEDHGVLVETCKGLTIVLQTGHAKHLSGDRGRRSGHLTGNCIVLSAWICGHSSFHLTFQGFLSVWGNYSASFREPQRHTQKATGLLTNHFQL